jgi:hypothetical protein
VKYVYICSLVVCLLLGGIIGHRLFPRTELREVPKLVTKVETVTKEVIKQADGTVIERVVTQTKDQTKTSPQQKPQYRVGALLPIANELKLPTVTVSRRAFGEVWLDAQYDPRHNEALIGISVEF